MAFHGAEGKGVGRKVCFFSHEFTMLYFLPSPPVASRTCDLEAKPIIKKKILIICKCPNSVHLESIVEKEEN